MSRIGFVLLLMVWTAFSSTPARGEESCPHARIEVRLPMRAGHHLAGTLTTPRGKQLTALAVFVSGAGPQTRDYSTVDGLKNRAFEVIEDSLVCRGVASFRYDEVGTGASSGLYASYATTRTLANDLEDAVTALTLRDEFRSAPIVLLGHSEGGSIASIVASSSRRVSAVVLMAAPASDGMNIMREQWTISQSLGESEQAMQAEHHERIRNDGWYRFFLAFDPAPFYTKVSQPSLILQGAKDNRVARWHADTMAARMRRAGNSNVQVEHLPHHGHLFVIDDAGVWPFDPKVAAMVASWIAQVLRSNEAKR
jgi:uncharacterized protein